jgi:hypothetical protein
MLALADDPQQVGQCARRQPSQQNAGRFQIPKQPRYDHPGSAPIGLEGRLMPTDKPLYFCPNCNALYQIVKVEAGPETISSAITCRACGGPLPAREGKFVLKYFMLRKAARDRKWRRR